MNQIAITALDTARVEELIDLARRIWHAHYPGIITVRQIDYMLDRGYTPAVIRDEVARGIVWLTILDGNRMIGFASLGLSGDKTWKLHKLYLLPDYHGRGIGARALAEVERIAGAAGAGQLILNVNKHNHIAIRSYRRAGWEFAEEVVVDIGEGFVMDDYVMARQLGAAGQVIQPRS